MNPSNKMTIISLLKLFLKIFAGLSILIIILTITIGNSPFELKYLIYPVLFTVTMTLLCVLIMFSFDYWKKYRERQFFNREPYSEIDKRTLEIRNVKKSKFDFTQIQRIIEINGNQYAIEYYDDLVKFPYSDVLIVYNETHPDNDIKVINYKENTFNLNQLLEIIKEEK